MEKISEISMRYLKDSKIFELKFFEEMSPLPIEEAKVREMVASAPDADSKRLLGAIVEAAKCDPKGSWVSASSEPVAQGQVILKG